MVSWCRTRPRLDKRKALQASLSAANADLMMIGYTLAVAGKAVDADVVGGVRGVGVGGQQPAAD